MPVKQSDYEILLSKYSDRTEAIDLLKQYRPYLELLPSMRRPDRSLITIPLPIVRLRNFQEVTSDRLNLSPSNQTVSLPCDLTILMCDPEWKIKMGVEILVFIHRPQEDFSDLLGRWRRSQVFLDREYEWLMPENAQDMFSDAAEKIKPLFVVFEETPERIKKGLAGACLPFVLHKSQSKIEDEAIELFVSQECDRDLDY
jgi:hypothetical protein